MAQICNDFLHAGTAGLTQDTSGIDVAAWAAIAHEASTRLQRSVQIKNVDGVLAAKVMDWPATSSELEMSMQQIRQPIKALGSSA